jgi:phospholipid/cholesterol/gamma-HCH transport system ATP-binding protein
MRRRVSIARALVDQPPVVFYDSPTAGLDPVTSQTIITLVLRGRDLQGVTSLLATHRVQDAFGLASFRLDRANGRLLRINLNGLNGASLPDSAPPEQSPATNVLILRDGRVYFEGEVMSLLHSSDEYVKTFLQSAE